MSAEVGCPSVASAEQGCVGKKKMFQSLASAKPTQSLIDHMGMLKREKSVYSHDVFFQTTSFSGGSSPCFDSSIQSLTFSPLDEESGPTNRDTSAALNMVAVDLLWGH